VTKKESTMLDASPAFDNLDKWVTEALKEPDSFAMWESRPEMFVTWSLGPVHVHRDSSILEQVNSNALIKHLESDPTLQDQWENIGCSHWAVGHVDHLAFQVIEPTTDSNATWKIPGRPGFSLTRIARVIKQWFDDLSDYPCADDAALSDAEYEASIKAIEDSIRGVELIDNVPDDWPSQVYDIVVKNGKILVEGDGAYVEEADVKAALEKLGFIKPDDGDDDED
jgi:hypothetical protein